MEVVYVVALGVTNFLSVLFAVWFLHWRQERQKRMFAKMFLQSLGDQIQTEADFQKIIKNLDMDNFGPDNEEKDK